MEKEVLRPPTTERDVFRSTSPVDHLDSRQMLLRRLCVVAEHDAAPPMDMALLDLDALFDDAFYLRLLREVFFILVEVQCRKIRSAV